MTMIEWYAVASRGGVESGAGVAVGVGVGAESRNVNDCTVGAELMLAAKGTEMSAETFVENWGVTKENDKLVTLATEQPAAML